MTGARSGKQAAGKLKFVLAVLWNLVPYVILAAVVLAVHALSAVIG